MSTRRQSEEKKQFSSRGSIKATLAERRETVKGLSKPEKRLSRELASSSQSFTPDQSDKQKIQKSKKVNGQSVEKQQSHATTDSNNTNISTSEQTSSGALRDSSKVIFQFIKARDSLLRIYDIPYRLTVCVKVTFECSGECGRHCAG